MATHSSTLAWKIPWTEEPGRLQFMGPRSRTRMSNLYGHMSINTPSVSSLRIFMCQVGKISNTLATLILFGITDLLI